MAQYYGKGKLYKAKNTFLFTSHMTVENFCASEDLVEARFVEVSFSRANLLGVT